MSEPAVKRMTGAEFLRWEGGTDIRYELMAGAPVAMAPPPVAHGMLAVRLCAKIEPVLQSRRPCAAQLKPAVAAPDRDDTCYIADIAVSCTLLARGQLLLEDPLLIVEILSPETALYDRQTKVADYRRIPSVEEVPPDRFGERLCRGAPAGGRAVDQRERPRSANDNIARLDRAHGNPVRSL